MIQTENMMPQVYVTESRDFQLLCHVFDAVYNSTKTGIDSITNCAIKGNFDSQLLELHAKTLGFNIKHNYDNESLYTILTCFNYILRYKGTKKAIEDAIRALLRAQNIRGNIEVDINNGNDGYVINIYVPNGLTNIILLEDLFDYILPVGYMYRIINYAYSGEGYDTKMKVHMDLTNDSIDSNELSTIANKSGNHIVGFGLVANNNKQGVEYGQKEKTNS